MAHGLGHGATLLVEVEDCEAVGIRPVPQLTPPALSLPQQLPCHGRINNMHLRTEPGIGARPLNSGNGLGKALQ